MLKYLLLLTTAIIEISCTSTRVLPDRNVETYGQGAAVHFRNGEFGKAMRLYKTGCIEAERLDIVALQARYSFNIGRIFYECNVFDSAARYFSTSSSLYQTEKHEAEASTVHLYELLTDAYRNEGKFNYSDVKHTAEKIATSDPQLVHTALALLYLLNGNADSALVKIGDAFVRLRNTEDNFSRGILFYYQAMAEFTRNNHQKSDELLDSSLACLSRDAWRYRNWKPLLGKSILAFCRGDSVSGEMFYRRAERAAPDLIQFPPVQLVKQCPITW